MSEGVSGETVRPPKAGGAPLLVTAELPPDVLAWADGLRRVHYPPERNRLRAHVTLFHALPPSAGEEVRRLLARLASVTVAPEAALTGLMDLGGGTALAIDSAATVSLHELIAAHLHGVIQQKDGRPLRLHITVQNKVDTAAARVLQAELARSFRPRQFRFLGLGLYEWDRRLWRLAQVYPFRGR